MAENEKARQDVLRACLGDIAEIEEYFDQRQDADHNGIDYVPNEEMRMLNMLTGIKGFLQSCALPRPSPSDGEVERLREALCDLHLYGDELCMAIECAEEDVGGCRDMQDILGDFGPAVDRAGGVLAETKHLSSLSPTQKEQG